MSLLAALALLQAAPAAAQDYRALGASPLWLVNIGPERMSFEADGRPTVSVATPPRRETELGFAHSSDELSVSVAHGDCTDALTGRSFADRVTVRVGAQSFEGCGGRSLSQGGPATYGAAGGEPFWWLEIADGRLLFTIDERAIIVRLPTSRTTRDGRLRIFENDGIRVAIRREDCELDDGRTYADAVTVTAGGHIVEGCGGRMVREAEE